MFRRIVGKLSQCWRFRKNSNVSSTSNWGTSDGVVFVANQTRIMVGLRRCGPPRCPSGKEDIQHGVRIERRRTACAWIAHREGTSWKCSFANRERSRWSSAAVVQTLKSCACKKINRVFAGNKFLCIGNVLQ